ncbi:MAG: hypothetical protein JRJ26_17820 [Deltaproteobacteria bacterium]|nr:hypothetical protein [Deltaproteobacteria bacterium]
MKRLYYHRWIQQFIIDEFSSEDSMRDYLFSNPNLIFAHDDFVIPIVEEKYLPESTLDKNFGRADIVLCRIEKETGHTISTSDRPDVSNVEAWIIELKKDEASYANGFKQLFDYMTSIRMNSHIQEEMINDIRTRIEGEFRIDNLQLKDGLVAICGALVAPSFDLIGRTRETIKNYGKDWEILEKNLRKAGTFDNGFTLFDAVHATHKLFSQVCLIKLIRFRRGDEVIVYSENALGSKAAAHISRVDPVDLFLKGLISEDDIFYFRDEKNRSHREVRCKVLRKRGRSHSFIVRIESLKDDKELDMPKWTNEKYVFETTKLPIENTTKNCSIALHKRYKVYDDKELYLYYWNFGDKDFVRERDGKSIAELREEVRSSGA